MMGTLRTTSRMLVCMLCVITALQTTNAKGEDHVQPKASDATTNPIKHFITIMMENRSFDHILGWLKTLNPEVDGLTGNEYNLEVVANASSRKIMVNKNGYDVGPDDPEHSWEATREQIYGYAKPVGSHAVANMSGFVQNALSIKHNESNVMSMFTPDADSAPILNTLAMEFAVFDRWFCSVPGPTDPNRGYYMSGTSNGMTSNWNGTHWSQQSYFNFLRQHNHTYRAYYQDDPWAIVYFHDMTLKENAQNVFELDQFFTDLKNNDLPEFTLLQPRMTSHKGPPTWQHPDASVREGERLLKEIYEALRASDLWETSMLVITYDEHGGFYDHVAPPQDGVPSPDGVKDANGFNFDRLGIRIPTVAVSPWINKGTVVHEPKGPTKTSQFDATSVMATVNKMLGINESLTKRAAWAGTFEDIVQTRDTPRTDCPTTLPVLPNYTAADLTLQRNRPLNDHIQLQVEYYCKVNGYTELDCGAQFDNQYDASVFIGAEAAKFMQRIKQ